jgi:hypothetical protein
MKEASGGHSSLRKVVRKSFWTLPISGRRRRRLAICFWKIDWVLRVFSSRIIYRRRDDVRR